MGGTSHDAMVAKTQTLLDFDDKLKNAPVRATVLHRIHNGDNWSDILDQEQLMTDANKRADYASNWFGSQPPSFWPGHANKVEIMIDGYRKALELSLAFGFEDRPATLAEAAAKITEVGSSDDYGLPVVSYWLNTEDEFSVLVQKSDYQVTVHIVTPKFPQNVVPTQARTRHEGIWVVSNQDRANRIVGAAGYTVGGTKNHTVPVSEVNGQVHCTPIYG